ncbi:hypothetical protein PHMEG_00026485 [Phytophthora megakarya]|uniref:Uncharacterized protein n=1 Tax=Phytophthora megakarya TaxID=4795 RepID=A0A225VAW0_9STRA|nr:hypothetical protein PHMEG_00026485 [Phytophthora megakarya]
MKKHQDESVHKFAARVKEIVRLFMELPVNAEVIPEVQQMALSQARYAFDLVGQVRSIKSSM